MLIGDPGPWAIGRVKRAFQQVICPERYFYGGAQLLQEKQASFSMLYVRDRGSSGYEVRIAVYDSSKGSKIGEEVYTGIRDLNIEVGARVVKIGNREAYMVVRGSIRGVQGKPGELYIRAAECL